MRSPQKQGILLINLGTPDAAEVPAVKRYLKEFLSDPYVVDINPIARWILVNLCIVPTRTKRSTQAYQKIWSADGSPLLIHSQALTQQLQTLLGDKYSVALGMRYGKPSIASAIKKLMANNVEHITVLPLFPQYSLAATESAIQKTIRIFEKISAPPSITIIQDFHNHPAFIYALSDSIRGAINETDYLLLSYHGLPERQIIKTGCKQHCGARICPTTKDDSNCYRSQCHHTSRLVAEQLQLNDNQYQTCFQSRLGRTPWIKPYTDEVLTQLAKRGIKKIAIACPSFVADCLESLEEIGIRARQQWLALGGTSLTLIPCLNDKALWVKDIITHTST